MAELQKLIKKGYLDQEIDTHDRRYMTIKLTEKGKECANEINNAKNKCEQKLLSLLNKTRLTEIRKSLLFLISMLENNRAIIQG